MEQLFIIVIFAAIGLMKWLASNKAEKFQPRDQTKHTTSAYGPIPQREEETEEMRMRRFMEALGVPAGSVPRPTKAPPRVRPMAETPRVPPPKLTPAPVYKKVEEAAAPVFETVVNAPESSYVAAPLFATRDPDPVVTPRKAPADLRGLLRSAGSLRDAVVLREILGPPRSLQSLR